jgi:hypothetical protein
MTSAMGTQQYILAEHLVPRRWDMCKMEWTYVVGSEALPYVHDLTKRTRSLLSRTTHENSRVDEWGERA